MSEPLQVAQLETFADSVALAPAERFLVADGRVCASSCPFVKAAASIHCEQEAVASVLAPAVLAAVIRALDFGGYQDY